ncbi:MAG: glycosyltransferase family 39 protein [Candidatus Moranbacteria bacterium]|nr:glycosyltransferase family 39 protein [Candidatus Moranbacteria bacterium]
MNLIRLTSKRIQKISTHTWILIFIIAVGIFLRTYNLREWLYFYPDQARDLTIVQEVIDGERSWPLMGAIAASTKFKIGPVYYYFQIISGYIFGARPETMAYPDLFFSILSIPLFYYFFSRYFTKNLSLALTGLYTVSYYVIEYSRFAWNPNPIPFFMLLFLISLWKFLLEENNTKWYWVLAIGITFGVGVQLHTLLLLLLPAVLFFAFVFMIRKDRHVWKKWVAIFALAVFLNIPQIISEMDKNYTNSKQFLRLFTESSENGKEKMQFNLKLDILGNSQSYAHIASSLGNKLDFDFLSIINAKIRDNQRFGIPFQSSDYIIFFSMFLSVLFFLFGCWAIGYYFIKEDNKEKKYFLGMLLLYVILSLIIMHPVMDSLAIRYFIHLVFLPFLFLGFLVKLMKDKYPKIYLPISISIFVFLLFSNIFTISKEARAHAMKSRSSERYVVLGEIEIIRDYMLSQSPDKTIYFWADGKYMQNFIKPLTYVMMEKGASLVRVKKFTDVPSGRPIIMLGESSDINTVKYFHKYDITIYKNFGQLGVYIIKN